MKRRKAFFPVLAGLVPLFAVASYDRTCPKRATIFEFAEKPSVERQGDRITISFASRAFCDATVAIETTDGRIVRHLASGLLGDNAPPPFQKGSLKQVLTWDGKDDQGQYVDAKDKLHVRFSLGLRPRFERNLFYSPHKRFGNGIILLAADQEGVYVYDVHGCETIRLYDHKGDYVRTVYPFPAEKIGEVKDLPWFTFPDGCKAPRKRGYFLATLLTGPESGGVESTIRITSESSAMTVRNGRLALVGLRLNRLATDGSSGGLSVYGPFMDVPPREYKHEITAKSAALSPDGKYLYLTAYAWLKPRGWAPVTDVHWRYAVYRMEYASTNPPTLFLGEALVSGNDETHFDHPSAVAVDESGRIYVADHLNNRVQVFSPDGNFLQSVPVEAPARLALHHKTQELYVFSWFLSRSYDRAVPQKQQVQPSLRKFSPFPEMKLLRTLSLPLESYQCEAVWSRFVGQEYQVTLDSWTEPPTVWLVPRAGGYPILLEERPEGLVKVRDFLEDAKAAGIRLKPPPLNRQRLYVDHLRGSLYLAEGDVGTAKAFSNLIRIDPETGSCKEIELPFSASDAAFSVDGLIHLRTGSVVGRYDPVTWREIPFDYGEECVAAYSYDGRHARLIGGLVMPSEKTNPSWHHGGMALNAKGDLVVTCFNERSRQIPTRQTEKKDRVIEQSRPYTPKQYPGRWSSGHEVHIWDKTGRVLYEDCLAGHPRIVAGIGIDRECNIYANISVSVLVDGIPYWRRVGHRFDQVGTLVKFPPGRGKFLMSGSGPAIKLESPPNRPPEMDGIWVEGAEWLYPGVGRVQWGMDCSCWNSRFVLDLFARSFAPEYDRFSVAVLDSAGNLITRVGRYGNVDDGVPLATDKQKENASRSRPLGGDEVAFFDGTYLATHTDRRLFIADPGNGRIVSVRLDYHATETVSLKNVPDKPRD
ncbi:MAG: hypothetical protein N2255_01785 [Kiritimatiellae bacterium]|nr:hypothetical protein [Kiritimatiellia bacterium]